MRPAIAKPRFVVVSAAGLRHDAEASAACRNRGCWRDMQAEFNFGETAVPDGYERWQAQRQTERDRLARQIGLPLGHAVEIWLRNNIRLRGKLRLREETLFLPSDRDFRLELEVDGVPFTPAEIESCVRMDA